jgi:hypothetical protein
MNDEAQVQNVASVCANPSTRNKNDDCEEPNFKP